MPSSKDISHLTKDLEQNMIALKSKVASAMVQDLQERGPWWTGHFATSWKISETPVAPVKKSRKRAKKVPLEKPLYVGNEAEYAGFAVNNPGATAPVGSPNGITYSEHAGIVRQITPPSGSPDWYKIYLQNQQFNEAILLGLSETFKGKHTPVE